MVYRIGILLCAIGTALAGADGSQAMQVEKSERPDTEILKPRDLKELSHQTFNELLSKALADRARAAAALPKVAAGRQVCSIPLLEAPIDQSKHFSMKTIPTGPRSSNGSEIPNPAPACQDWQAGR